MDDLIEYYMSNRIDGYSKKYVEDKLVEKLVNILDVLGDKVLNKRGGEYILKDKIKERL